MRMPAMNEIDQTQGNDDPGHETIPATGQVSFPEAVKTGKSGRQPLTKKKNTQIPHAAALVS